MSCIDTTKPEAPAKETLNARVIDPKTRRPTYESTLANVTISFARASGFSGRHNLGVLRLFFLCAPNNKGKNMISHVLALCVL